MGSKLLMLNTVNSPTLAIPQKQTVRHANMAASRGLLGLSWDLKRERMSGVKGSRCGHLEEGGVRREAPSMIALSVGGSMCQGLPCSMCQARMPAT